MPSSSAFVHLYFPIGVVSMLVTIWWYCPHLYSFHLCQKLSWPCASKINFFFFFTFTTIIHVVHLQPTFNCKEEREKKERGRENIFINLVLATIFSSAELTIVAVAPTKSVSGTLHRFVCSKSVYQKMLVMYKQKY